MEKLSKSAFFVKKNIVIKKTLLFLLGVASFTSYSQKVLWEKTIGGEHSEYLFDMVPTFDYGFLLAGSFISDKSGKGYPY